MSPFNSNLPDHIIDLIRKGQRVEAIKQLRNANPGMGLREAKDIVDAKSVEMGIPLQTPGCASLLVAVMVMLALRHFLF